MYSLIFLLFVPAILCGDLKPVLDKLLVVPAGCVIPRDADNIMRAALLQQCLSPSKGKVSDEERCFGDLGCFPMKAPWTTNLRPFPQPMTPDEMDLQVVFYSRDNPKNGQVIKLWPNITLDGVKFDAKRPYTTFITHGFTNYYNMSWIQNLKDAYLKARDANVFIVDWHKAAIKANYLQVASNTRVVGAAVGRFVKVLREQKGLKPEQLHLIGHSLGAHISAYIAKANPKPSVITALDPAQPGFEGTDASVRLYKSDAEFVEAIHTSGRPFIPLFGCGFITPVGHVDFFFNGGAVQPSCALPPPDAAKQLTSISDLALVPVEVFADWVSCSHNMAHKFYTEAISPENNCTFIARKTGKLAHLSNTLTAGLSHKLTNPILSTVANCKADSCTVFGLETSKYPASGSFLVNTNSKSPYCRVDTGRTETLDKAVNGENPEVESVQFLDLESKTEDGTPALKPSMLSPIKNILDKIPRPSLGLGRK